MKRTKKSITVTDARIQRNVTSRNHGKGYVHKRPGTSSKCYLCGGVGHRQAGCPSKATNNDNSEKHKPNLTNISDGRLTCVYCKKKKKNGLRRQ